MDRTLHYYTRPSEETGLVPILRDRQKRPGSIPYTTRPSEKTELVAILRDRQKRPDSIRSSRAVVVARQPLASRDQKFCSTMFVEQPLYTHWRCPQCNARDGSQPSRLHLTYSRQPRVQAGHDPYRSPTRRLYATWPTQA